MIGATLHLADRAQAAWSLATIARHDPNWGRALRAGHELRAFIRDPNPHIRRVAEDIGPGPIVEVLPPCA